MLKLFSVAPAWGCADISPFVAKVDLYLRMTGVRYSLVPLPGFDLSRSPKGKIPYIDDDGTLIGDSSAIIDYIRRTRRVALDQWLTPGQVAVATAFTRMLEESYYWNIAYIRYCDEDTHLAYYGALWRELLPYDTEAQFMELVRAYLAHVRGQLHSQGRGRHTPDEITAIAIQELDAVATFLEQPDGYRTPGPFFFGARPTTIDATVYSMLSGTILAPFPSPIRDHALAKPVLRAYVDQLFDTYFQDLAPARLASGAAAPEMAQPVQAIAD